MKYLILAALAAIVFLLVYARVRPYLKLIRKVVESLNVATESTVTTASSRERTPAKSKLLRCDSCGTWIPADRALHVGSGLSTFCSPECLTKDSQAKERKLAG